MSKRFMLTAAGTASAAVAGIASAELIDFTVIQDQYIGEASYQIINSAGSTVASMYISSSSVFLPGTSGAVSLAAAPPVVQSSTKPLSPLTLPLVTTRSLCKTLGVMAGIGTASKVASLSPETSMVPHRRTSRSSVVPPLAARSPWSQHLVHSHSWDLLVLPDVVVAANHTDISA